MQARTSSRRSSVIRFAALVLCILTVCLFSSCTAEATSKLNVRPVVEFENGLLHLINTDSGKRDPLVISSVDSVTHCKYQLTYLGAEGYGEAAFAENYSSDWISRNDFIANGFGKISQGHWNVKVWVKYSTDTDATAAARTPAVDQDYFFTSSSQVVEISVADADVSSGTGSLSFSSVKYPQLFAADQLIDGKYPTRLHYEYYQGNAKKGEGNIDATIQNSAAKVSTESTESFVEFTGSKANIPAGYYTLKVTMQQYTGDLAGTYDDSKWKNDGTITTSMTITANGCSVTGKIYQSKFTGIQIEYEAISGDALQATLTKTQDTTTTRKYTFVSTVSGVANGATTSVRWTINGETQTSGSNNVTITTNGTTSTMVVTFPSSATYEPVTCFWTTQQTVNGSKVYDIVSKSEYVKF